MNSEIRIDLKVMMKWILHKWKLLIPGFVLLSILLGSLLYLNEVIAYRHETSKLYSMETCLNHMSENALRDVNLTLAMDEIMKGKEDELERLRQADSLTEEQFLRMEELLEDIDKIRALNIGYRYSFDNYQARYYALANGLDENEIRPYPTVTKNMIFGGMVIGFVMVFAISILLYLLSGYLHSEDEIRMNFGYRVNTVEGDDKLADSVKLLLESDRWDKQGQVAVLGIFKKDCEDCLKVVADVTKGKEFTNFMQDISALTQIKEMKQALIVARVNDTRYRTMRQLHETLSSLQVEIMGVLLIKE